MKNIPIEACTALVPVEQSAARPKMPFSGRPDAPFIAQLIATAAGAAQTCKLQRATPADALKGYGQIEARRIEPSRPRGACVSLVA